MAFPHSGGGGKKRKKKKPRQSARGQLPGGTAGRSPSKPRRKADSRHFLPPKQKKGLAAGTHRPKPKPKRKSKPKRKADSRLSLPKRQQKGLARGTHKPRRSDSRFSLPKPQQRGIAGGRAPQAPRHIQPRKPTRPRPVGRNIDPTPDFKPRFPRFQAKRPDRQAGGGDLPFGTVRPRPAASVVSKQRFLRALGAAVRVDGRYGPRTQAAEIAQRRRGGLVGRGRIDSPGEFRVAQERALALARNRQRTRRDSLRGKLSRIESNLSPKIRYSLSEQRAEKRRVRWYEDWHRSVNTPEHRAERLRAGTMESLTYARRYLIPQGNVNSKTMLAHLFDPDQGVWRARAGETRADVGKRISRDRENVVVLQRWLRKEGHDAVRVNGLFGPRTYRALEKARQENARQEARIRRRAIRDLFDQAGIVSARGEVQAGGGDLPFGIVSKKINAKKLDQLLRSGSPLGETVLLDVVSRAEKMSLLDLQAAVEFVERQVSGPTRMSDREWIEVASESFENLVARHGLREARRILGMQQVLNTRLSGQRQKPLRLTQIWQAGIAPKWLDPDLVVNYQETGDDGLLGPASRSFFDVLKEGFGTAMDAYQWTIDQVKIGGVDASHYIRDPLEFNVTFDPSDWLDRYRKEKATVERFKREHPVANFATEFAIEVAFGLGVAGLRSAGAKLAARGTGLAVPEIARTGVILPGLRESARTARIAAGVEARSAAALASRLAERGYRLSMEGRLVSVPVVRTALRQPYLRGQQISTYYDAVLASTATDPLARWILGPSVRWAHNATRLRNDVLAESTRRVHEAARRGFKVVSPAGRHLRPRKADQALVDSAARRSRRAAFNLLPRSRKRLFENRVSMYADEARGTPSVPGYQFLAYAESRIAAQEIRRYAAKEADAAKRLHKVENPGATDADLKKVWGKRFGAALRSSPLHFDGVGDPNVLRIVNPRIKERVDALWQHVLPSVQDVIEESVPKAQLFGSDGLWLGRRGPVVQTARARAREQFEKVNVVGRRNPNYGQLFDPETRDFLKTTEIANRTGRLAMQKRVREASGEELAFDFEGEQAFIAQEVEASWRLVRGGWTDTRPMLFAPEMYSKHLVRVGEAKRGTPYLWDEDEMEEILYALRFIDEGAPLFADAMRASNEMLHALALRRGAIEKASPHVFARDLAHEGALWQALRQAQTRPLRVVYVTLAAMMNTWRFLTLPMQPGWTAVNDIDNTVKTILRGIVDPRAWFVMAPDGKLHSIFGDFPIVAYRWLLDHLGRMFGEGTRARELFDAALGYVWAQPVTRVRDLFGLHGIPVPEDFIRAAKSAKTAVTREARIATTKVERPSIRYRDVPVDTRLYGANRAFEGGDDLLPRFAGDGKIAKRRDAFALEEADIDADLIDPTFVQKNAARLASFHDNVWELMGNKHENYFRRVVYRQEYRNSIREGASERDAALNAWKAVEDTLFDYSKVTVLEDNLRLFFPFIQFARKNSQYWAKQFASQPPTWLGVYGSYREMLEDINSDKPEWAKRYVSLGKVASVLGHVPGMDWLASTLEDAEIDPLNIFSLKYYYRLFKGENPFLPEDRAGIEFLDSMASYVTSFGFFMNPYLHKSLELAGVLSLQAWRDIFPQTNLVEALTAEFFADRFPHGINIEHWLIDLVYQQVAETPLSEIDKRRFDELVNREVAAQILRGEKPDRGRAEERVRDFLLVQNLIGSFGGAWIRDGNKEAYWFADMANAFREGTASFLNLLETERIAYRAYKNRKWSEAAFEQYIDLIPQIREHYSMSWLEGQEYLNTRPYLRPWVEEKYGMRDSQPRGWAQEMLLQGKTNLVIGLQELLETAGVSGEVYDAARRLLISRDLEAYWALNDTPRQIRVAQMRMEYRRHVDNLNETYHSLPTRRPDGSYSPAREEFLRDHPELVQYWNWFGAESGDYKAIIQNASKAMRDRYFEILGENPEGPDFERAINFLQRFPWIFEDTRKRAKYREVVKLGYFPAKSARGRAYQGAKRWIDYYFSLSEGKRAAWLDGDSKGAAMVRDYFARYSDYTPFSESVGGGGGLSQHAIDYRAARRWLDYYFDLPKSRRSEWLRGNSAGAKVVRDYFDKYAGEPKPKTQRGRDYVKAKRWIDHFFALMEKDRDRAFAWLDGNSKGAKIARKYFDKYGKPKSQKAKDFENAEKWLKKYFSMSEEARGRWLDGNSKGAAIVRAYFEKYAEQSQRAEDFDRAKKHLDHYFTLRDRDEEAARRWLEGPSKGAAIVRAYFEKYADQTESEHSRDYEAIKPVLTTYFNLRKTSPEAARAYLDQHPELERYFDKYAEEGGQSQHAMDFEAAKPWLDYYFALAPDLKRSFLNGNYGDPLGAAIVRDYFAKYATIHRIERSFRHFVRRPRFFARRFQTRSGGSFVDFRDDPDFQTNDPELRKRLEFWAIYFQLEPSDRPQFVAEHAAEHGIFVYGTLGRQVLDGRESDHHRRSFAWTSTAERVGTMAFAKPLVDFYFSLPDAEKDLFRRANPEIDAYFDAYGIGPKTGNATLDALIERYFKLPRGSRARSGMLQDHPQLQAWFDSNSTPEDRALHDLLDVYFSLTGPSRRAYLLQYPEIEEYFDRRNHERELERIQLEAFDRADPRFAPFLEKAEWEVHQAAMLRLYQMDSERARDIVLDSRRERAPVAA